MLMKGAEQSIPFSLLVFHQIVVQVVWGVQHC